jgi:hypothetical protein
MREPSVPTVVVPGQARSPAPDGLLVGAQHGARGGVGARLEEGTGGRGVGCPGLDPLQAGGPPALGGVGVGGLHGVGGDKVRIGMEELDK